MEMFGFWLRIHAGLKHERRGCSLLPLKLGGTKDPLPGDALQNGVGRAEKPENQKSPNSVVFREPHTATG